MSKQSEVAGFLSGLANYWLGGWIMLAILAALGVQFPGWFVRLTSPVPFGQMINPIIAPMVPDQQPQTSPNIYPQ